MTVWASYYTCAKQNTATGKSLVSYGWKRQPCHVISFRKSKSCYRAEGPLSPNVLQLSISGMLFRQKLFWNRREKNPKPKNHKNSLFLISYILGDLSTTEPRYLVLILYFDPEKTRELVWTLSCLRLQSIRKPFTNALFDWLWSWLTFPNIRHIP